LIMPWSRLMPDNIFAPAITRGLALVLLFLVFF
jgi:hypothetical protein